MASIPDDLIRQHGAAAFQAILDNKTAPLFDVLIEREEQRGEPAVTPEQRASLEARLKALVARIADPGVRGQYETRAARRRCGRRTASWRAQIARLRTAGATPRFAGKRRDNTQLDWRVAARATERVAARRPAARPPVRRPLPCAATSLPSAIAAAAGPRGPADPHPPQPSLAAGGALRGGRRAHLDLPAARPPARRPARAACPEHRP